MIRELDIRNLAIVDHLRIKFRSGMTVLTGETGAGKSVIIGALGLLAGNRGSKKFIRSGTNKLFLQGLFTFPRNARAYQILDHYGISHADGNVIIQRRIYHNGRNVCRVNGYLVNTAVLGTLGKAMVDIQGQDAHQILMNPLMHLHLLDAFDRQKISPVLQAYHRVYRHYHRLTTLAAHRKTLYHQWAQRWDMLNFQKKEIESAHLRPHEDQVLVKRRGLLRHYKAINAALKRSYASINGDGNYAPLDLIGDAMNAMKGISRYDSRFRTWAVRLQNAYYSLQDTANSIASEVGEQELDRGELERIETRLTLIDRLELKYGDSVTSVLNHLAAVKKSLARLRRLRQRSGQLGPKLYSVKQRLFKLSQRLSRIRHRVAGLLDHQIHAQLAGLYMQRTQFHVRFTDLHRFAVNGTEKIEFYVRINPGESWLPLAKSASGGELSRLLLALKTIFARVHSVGTAVFDEIDTGVGGRVAQAVADKLLQITRYSQVLCITHSPQVAAMGDHHDLVWKKMTNRQTRTALKPLGLDGQVKELARMLAGTKVTKSALVHAKELIKLAQHSKKIGKSN